MHGCQRATATICSSNHHQKLSSPCSFCAGPVVLRGCAVESKSSAFAILREPAASAATICSILAHTSTHHRLFTIPVPQDDVSTGAHAFHLVQGSSVHPYDCSATDHLVPQPNSCVTALHPTSLCHPSILSPTSMIAQPASHPAVLRSRDITQYDRQIHNRALQITHPCQQVVITGSTILHAKLPLEKNSEPLLHCPHWALQFKPVVGFEGGTITTCSSTCNPGVPMQRYVAH